MGAFLFQNQIHVQRLKIEFVLFEKFFKLFHTISFNFSLCSLCANDRVNSILNNKDFLYTNCTEYTLSVSLRYKTRLNSCCTLALNKKDSVCGAKKHLIISSDLCILGEDSLK